MKVTMARCKGCTNHCLLTINKFSGGRQFISGNRCERGLGKEKYKSKILPNLYEYKNEQTFTLQATSCRKSMIRGEVGIPRVLEYVRKLPILVYILYRTGIIRLFSSPASSRKHLFELGIESIPSESECYPAKLAHGHITWLIKQGVPYIFYPCCSL